IPGVGPVVAAGWLAATAAGAAAGAVAGGAAGGIIGALTSSGVPERDAHFYAEGVRRGGTLVTAKVDDALAPEAEAILKRSNWVEPTERRAAYEKQGWTHFDETLSPYEAEQIEQERLRYRGNGM
ncbi:membrane protein, partial [Rhizobium sp. H41]